MVIILSTNKSVCECPQNDIVTKGSGCLVNVGLRIGEEDGRMGVRLVFLHDTRGEYLDGTRLLCWFEWADCSLPLKSCSFLW